MTDELDRLILGAVGDDFVTLEHIVNRLAIPGGRVAAKVDPELLRQRLVDLIADRLISAYLLHADPPYITPVKVSTRSLQTSWFYITQRGRKCLANSAKNRAHVQSGDSDSKSQDPYPPAVNF
jgi:hypothetical protein